MKRLVSLLLTLAMLLGMVGSVAVAEEAAATKITVAEPTVDIDSKGNVTVKLSDGMKDMDGYINVTVDGKGIYTVSLEYDSKKDAYTGSNTEVVGGKVSYLYLRHNIPADYSNEKIRKSTNEYYRYEYSDGKVYDATISSTVTTQENVSFTYKNTEGKEATRDNFWLTTSQTQDVYTAWFYDEEGKQTYGSHTVTESTADTKTKTTKTTREYGYINADTDVVYRSTSSTSTSSFPAEISESGYLSFNNYYPSTSTFSSEVKDYNQYTGKYTGKTITETENTFSTVIGDKGTPLTSKTTTKSYYDDGAQKSTRTTETSTTYNSAKDARTTVTKGESASYNEYGVLIATGKTSGSTEVKYEDDYTYTNWEGKEITVKNWNDRNPASESSSTTRYNAAGTLVYSKTTNAKGDNSTTEEMSYDKYGKLSSGSKEVVTAITSHTETYNSRGLNSTTDTTYETIGDGKFQKKNTIINYDNVKDGKNVKSYESVETPENVKNEDGSLQRTLMHTSSAYYDKFGGYTKSSTFDQTYNEKDDTITSTETTVNYVGKPVEAEMHDKTVEVTVQDAEKTYNTATIRTTYDWEGNVTEVYERIYNYDVDEKGIATRINNYATYGPDGKTLISGSTSTEVWGSAADGSYSDKITEERVEENGNVTTEIRESGYDKDYVWYNKSSVKTVNAAGTTVYEFNDGNDEDGYYFYNTKGLNEEDGTSFEGKQYYDSKAEKSVQKETYYDADKKVIGTRNGEEVYDKEGNPIGWDYVLAGADGKTIYTEQGRDNGKTSYWDWTFVDASGKEIGYEKHEIVEGIEIQSYKYFNFDTSTFTMIGTSSEHKETVAKDSDSKPYVVTEHKEYDAGTLISESKSNTKDSEGYTKIYEEGKLFSDSETDAKGANTTTYYDNPDNVLSRVVKTTPEAKDEKTGAVTRVVTDTAYYSLDGKLDRHQVTTNVTEYTDEDNPYRGTKYTSTTEYRDSSDKAVTTSTTVTDYTDANKSYSETKKADGTVIEYTKYSGYDKDDTWHSYGTTERKTVSSMNYYTGYVGGYVEESKTVKNKDGSSSETTIRKTGEDISYEYKYEKDADGNYTSNTKSYSNSVYYDISIDGYGSSNYRTDNYYLNSDNTTTYDAKAKTTKTETTFYRYSGDIRRTSESVSAYDKDKDLTITTTNYYNSDGELVYTTESEAKRTAYGEAGVTGTSYGPGSSYESDIINTTYKDVDGNEIGYSRYDASGNYSSKVPEITYSGNLDGGWTETTSSAATWTNNNISSSNYTRKTYDKNGVLTFETTATEKSSVTKYYWENSSVVKTEVVKTDLNNGKVETVTTINNEDGTLRRKTFEETGRETGTHFNDKSVSYYGNDGNGLGVYMYGYEYREDLQKDETTWTYTDASGKVIGHSRIDNPDGSWSVLVPDTENMSARTGEIPYYHEYGADKEGNEYEVWYDEDMKETDRYQNVENEDGDLVWTHFVYGKTQPADTSWEGITTHYNSKGEVLSYDEYEEYAYGIGNSQNLYYNQNGDLVYSTLNNVQTADSRSSYTLWLDSEGNVIGYGNNYNALGAKTEDNGDFGYLKPETTISNNITGFTEFSSQDYGKININRGYDKNMNLIGETYRYTDRVFTDDQIVITETNKDGRVVSVETVNNDIDNNIVSSETKYYSLWSGKNTGIEKKYYDDPTYTKVKYTDENGNVTWYGWRWSYNNYSILQDHWVNGQLQQYSWNDKLDGNEQHSETYYANGNYEEWYDEDKDGNSQYWYYDTNGVLRYYSESTNGITNVIFYNADGSISGYDWGITNPEDGYGDWNASDSVVWSATAVKYNKHIVSNPNDVGTIETWTDAAGNVKTITRADETTATVKLASTANGWQSAFGDEWYYVEGGKPVTGWKVIGGTWYYFNEDGSMATGLVQDGATTYAMDKDGAYVAAGWNQDTDGSWSYVENGLAATGWKNIGGTWYYFDNGWYVKDYVDGEYTNGAEYDTDVGTWDQYTPGTMVTGAAHIWNSTWTDKDTYFFNADGSWDTSAGWKSDGIDYYYFFDGGVRATGWQNIGGTWYYFNDKGVMRNGWVGDGNWYYMNEDGSMAADQWVQERFEDDWYYTDASGAMVTGWKNVNGAWYYFNGDGTMAQNQWAADGGNWYYQGEDGTLSTGWVKDSGEWYYLGDDGALKFGWQNVGGAWYYFNGNGAMVTGEIVIDGVTNVFNADGVWTGTK